MALGPGTRVGVYQVIAPLGSGGMGVVYQLTLVRRAHLSPVFGTLVHFAPGD